MKLLYKLSIVILILSGTNKITAQDNAFILDRVVAVVGDFHILQSEIEEQYLQIKMSSRYVPDNIRCDILDYFIEQKLLMTQAKIDSIEVTEGQVALSTEQRLNAFISQFGTEEAMEEYFNKSIFDIRDDLKKTMKEVMITQQVQQSIVGDIQITPSDVKNYFKNLDPDSIPYIDSEVKYAQIVAYPPVDENSEFEVRERLLDLRKRIMDGESMSTLAILYSDDPTATSNFGELGFMNKNDLDPAYVEAAWSLKEGQVSKIVESRFGFHIIQCIARKGERVNTRHILLQPKINAAAKGKAIQKLDSLRSKIIDDSISFKLAALYFSEDQDTRASGGVVVNPYNMAASFELDELDTKDYYNIRDMKVGDISQPYETTDKNGKLCYKMIKLQSRSEPHRATIKEDYLLLQNKALTEKQNQVMDEWYKEKRQKTYIRVDDSFKYCESLEEQLTKR